MDQPGTYLPFTDTYLSRVNDIEECRSRCTIQNKYNCRSFNYNAFRKECFLSSDDSTTLQDGLHSDRDFIFSERGGCNSGAGEPPGIKGEPAKSEISLNCNFFLVLISKDNGNSVCTKMKTGFKTCIFSSCKSSLFLLLFLMDLIHKPFHAHPYTYLIHWTIMPISIPYPCPFT